MVLDTARGPHEASLVDARIGDSAGVYASHVSMDQPIPWETGRRRDLEAVMADEIPDPQWSVREVASTSSPQGGFLVRTEGGVHRFVRDLTPDLARRLADQLALTVRLRDV